MRNKYGGNCYRCNQWCAPGDGHFERHNGGWRVQHAECAISHRVTVQERNAALTPNERTKRRKLQRQRGRAQP